MALHELAQLTDHIVEISVPQSISALHPQTLVTSNIVYKL